MNRLSGAEAMVRLLQAHGVRHVFGLCGDTSLPLYDAFFRLDPGITHILTRDERHAGYMADAYARVTGKPGVCEGPSGGGATYILPGVVEANESSIPLLAITSDIATTSRGRFVLTELDQEALFRPLTKWNGVVPRAQMLPGMVRRAFREMTTGRPGAVHLGLPFDVQKEPVDEDHLWSEPRAPAIGPDPAAIARVGRLLADAARPVAIVGGGVHLAGAQEALADFARHFQIPIATTISGKGVIPDAHPLALGVVGSNGGTPETRAVVDEADLVILIGCRAGSVTTERWRHPEPGKVEVVHIDVDPGVPGTNYPRTTAVLADARLGLEAIRADRGAATGERAWNALARVTAAKAAKFGHFAELATSREQPIRPERLVAALQAALPERAVVAADPGTPCPYLAAYLTLGPQQRFMSNRAHGALGWSLAAAIGAAIGRPDAKAIAVMGDGSFAMACGELETIVRLDLPVTLIVVSNAVYGWIKAGQRTGFAERYFSVDFDRTDHAAVARAFGLEAWRVEDPDSLEAVLTRAIGTPRPTLVDVVCQPLQEARAPVSEWVA